MAVTNIHCGGGSLHCGSPSPLFTCFQRNYNEQLTEPVSKPMVQNAAKVFMILPADFSYQQQNPTSYVWLWMDFGVWPSRDGAGSMLIQILDQERIWLSHLVIKPGYKLVSILIILGVWVVIKSDFKFSLKSVFCSIKVLFFRSSSILIWLDSSFVYEHHLIGWSW